MTRTLLALLLTALAAPALADEYPYDQGDPGGYFGDEQQVEDGADVDVSVDLATPGATATFDTFHDGLASHGEWVTMPQYGRVWRPAGVAAGWRPYYYGRWEWTDEGWLWVSDEPWGWATYHYGRWAFDNGYGWVWVPGYQWAPAWVTWRYSPDYIGWAPLGPGFSVYVTSYPVVYSWWTFVPCARFVGVPVYTVGYTGGHVRNIWHGTQPAPPRAVIHGAPAPAWGGPARPFIETRAGRPVVPVRVQPVASPSAIAAAPRAGVVPIYRPELRPAAPRPGVPGQAFAPGRPAAPGRAGVAPVPGRGPAAAPAPGWGGNRPWGRPGQAAPAPQGQGAPRYAPPAPQGAPRYAPAPQPQPQRGYAPAPQGQGQGAPRYAPPAPQGAPRYAPPPQPQPQRGYAPAPQGQGAPRYAPPAPQGQAAPRYAPAPQGQAAPRYAPAPQPAPRAYAPAPQSAPRYSAPPSQAPRYAAPGPQGGHGGGGARPAPAPQRH
jgi:hypothetical protein